MEEPFDRHGMSDEMWRIIEPRFEWLMIDAAFAKTHRHGAGAVGGTQGKGLAKGGPAPRFIWPWMRLACRSDSLLRQVRRRTADMLSS